MHRKRNGSLIDVWSAAHFLSGLVFGLILHPIPALILLAAWEPFENLILSPILWKLFRINFGHESFKNALSDIVFDGLGVTTALLLIAVF